MKEEKLLRKQAYTQIKEIIINREPESHISLRKTAKKLGMSITPVREAFQSLEKEGLIKSIPNIGYFIPNYSRSDIIEIFQTRECLEMFVLEKTYNKLTDQDIKNLEQYLKEQEKYHEEGEIFKHYEMDEKFHMIFFDLYGNDYLKKLIEKVREQYSIIIIKSIKQHIMIKNNAKVIKEHYKILNAIKKGDKDTAMENMLTHITKAKQRALNVIDGNI